MEMYFKIDYLNFTIKPTDKPALARAFDILGQTPERLKPSEKGLYGYRFSYVCAGVHVLYSPDRHDVHVQITGKGCDFYKERLFDMFDQEAVTVTRCDLACDVVESDLTVDEIWGYLRQGWFCSASRTVRFISSSAKNQSTGATVYIGSRTSDKQLRIYDKGLESGTNKKDVWVRYEFQTRNDLARWVTAKLTEKRYVVGSYAEQEVFLNMIDFLKLVESPTEQQIKDNNLNRAKECEKWAHLWRNRSEWKGYDKQMKTPSLTNTIKYVKNTGAALKTLKGFMPDFYDFLEDVIEGAELKEKHLALLHALEHGCFPTGEVYEGDSVYAI